MSLFLIVFEFILNWVKQATNYNIEIATDNLQSLVAKEDQGHSKDTTNIAAMTDEILVDNIKVEKVNLTLNEVDNNNLILYMFLSR